MDAQRWRKLEGLFHAAAALEPDARTAYLRRAGLVDPALAAQVERLIAAGEQADRFISDILGRGRDREPP